MYLNGHVELALVGNGHALATRMLYATNTEQLPVNCHPFWSSAWWRIALVFVVTRKVCSNGIVVVAE